MAKQSFSVGQVLTAAQMTSLQQTAMLGGSTTAKTTSYTLVAADAGTVVSVSSTSATTITVNTALFSAGDTVTIQNWGSGAVTITAGTATVNTAGSLIVPQYDGGVLYFTSTSGAIYFDFVQAGAVSPLTTKGDLYTFASSDTRLGVGANGTILTADSAEATGLKWVAPAGGGKVLKVESTAKTDSFSASTSAGVYTDITGLSVSITPSSATSKILVIAMVSGSGAIGSNFAAVQLVRASTAIALADTAGSRLSSSSQLAQIGADSMTALPITFLDSPSTTSATTYKIQGCSAGGTGTVYINRSTTDANNSSSIRGVSTITVLEIGA
jgi:hypothetical protein